MKKLLALFAALLMISLVGPALAEGPVAVKVDVTYGQTEARGMLTLINEFRSGSDAWYWNEDNETKTVCTDLAPLKYDYDLEAAAMQRAAEIAVFFSHTRPNNTKCFTAFPSGSVSSRENIAAGYRSASAAFTGWREDDDNYTGQGHRRNMLSSKCTHIGIGHVVFNGMHYWTQALASRSTPNTTASGAADTTQTVVIEVLPSLVATVSAPDITLALKQHADFPAVTFILTETWPEKPIPYLPCDAENKPVWTASAPELITREENGITAVNAGELTLTATVFDKQVTSKVTIPQADLAGATVTVDASGLIYTGSAHTPAVTVSYGGDTLVQGTDYTVAYANNVNALSNAGVTVTGMGNYCGTAAAAFTIDKAPLKVTANDGSIVYGNAPAGNGVTFTGFVNGETESVLGGSVTYTYSCGKYDDVGSYTITPSGLTSGNYAITYAPGTLTVTPKEVGLSWAETELTYNGSKQLPTVTVTGTVNGDAVSATVTGTQINAGEYTATVTKLTGKKAGNYVLPAAVTADFRIQKAIPAVTAPTPVEGLVETGEEQALVKAGITTGGTLKYSLEKKGTYTEAIPTGKAAGTYTVWYRVDGDDNYEDIAADSVKVKILNKITDSVTVSGGVYALNHTKKTATLTKPRKKSVTKLTIPATVSANGMKYKVTAIADSACKGLKKLKAVTIGTNVTTIGKKAFASCTKLKTVKGGAKVATIGVSAFDGDKVLSSLPALKQLTKIGDYAFRGCKALGKITLAAKVKTIGKSAFQGCAKLKTIVIKTKLLTTKTVGKAAFKGIYAKAKVTCPKGMAKAYKKLLKAKGLPSKATVR